MARRFRVADGAAAIWEGAGDLLPFTNPDGNADRVLFTTKWNYTRIIDKRVVNVTFPLAKQGGERLGTINLFAHGITGYPRVRGNITLGGQNLSLGSHIPVQYLSTASAIRIRLATIGATQTNVVVCWYANMLGAAADLQAITLPVSVEITNEINV